MDVTDDGRACRRIAALGDRIRARIRRDQNVPVRHERSRRVVRSKIGVLDPAKGVPQNAMNIRTSRPGVGGLVVQGGVLIGADHERAAILQPHGWTQFEAKRRAG
jgi:hypothetical protein